MKFILAGGNDGIITYYEILNLENFESEQKNKIINYA